VRGAVPAGQDAGGERLPQHCVRPRRMKPAAQRRPGGRSAAGAGAHGREEMEAAAR
jgi:hypothetical protein